MSCGLDVDITAIAASQSLHFLHHITLQWVQDHISTTLLGYLQLEGRWEGEKGRKGGREIWGEGGRKREREIGSEGERREGEKKRGREKGKEGGREEGKEGGKD